MKFKILFVLALICLLIPSVSAMGGSGTIGDPYIIYDETDLQFIYHDLGAYYALGNDIYMYGVTWTPQGSADTPFIGDFDGRGYTIIRLNISSTDSNYGLFGVVSSGVSIRNFTLENCFITGTNSSVGMIAGSVIMSSLIHDTLSIENITINNSTINVGDESGTMRASYGIGYVNNYAEVEFNHVYINNCKLTSSGNFVGNFVGSINTNSNLTILNCQVNNCDMSASNSAGVGGFVGSVSGASSVFIDDTSQLNYSTVKNPSGYSVGGLVGLVNVNSNVNIYGNGNTLIESCQIIDSDGGIVGGIVGYANSYSIIKVDKVKVHNSVISATEDYVGGIIGLGYSNADVNITSCYIDDSVISGAIPIGGIAGEFDDGASGNFDDCVVYYSTIVGSNTNVGGIIGKINYVTYDITNASVIKSCIKGSGYVSGIAGIILV